MADKKPEGMEEEHFEFFDELRESGATNMFGAAIYMTNAGLADLPLAKKYLVHWMKTFKKRQESNND